MKHYFPHEYNARNDRKLKLVRSKFGSTGKELYWDIVEMLYCEDGYLPIIDIPIIADDYGVTPEFINDLLNLEIGNTKTLFQRNETHFWSESVLQRIKIIKEKSEKARRNAQARWDAEAEQKQGDGNADGKPKKPKKSSDEKTEYITIPEIEYVKLTEAEFKKLAKKHGEKRLLKAIEKLDAWLDRGTKKALEVRGKRHKSHFRSDCWVWEGIDEALKKDKAKEAPKTKEKSQAEQEDEQKRKQEEQEKQDAKKSICDKQTAIDYIAKYNKVPMVYLKKSSVFKELSEKYGITPEDMEKAYEEESKK